MKTFALITTLVLLAAQGRAEVLIYKGTIHVVSDATGIFPKSFTAFQVIDPATSSIGSAAALVVSGQKVQIVSKPSEFLFTQAPLANGKTATTISLVIASGGSNDFFSNIAFHFRGTNTTLKTSTQLGSGGAIFPRLITGRATLDQASNGDGAFTEQKVLFAYQEARTIAANDAGQTALQVLAALSLELEGKGFQQPAP